MGHSIPKYKGKTVVINDGDLLVVIGFALQIIHESTQFENLRSLTAAWEEVPKMYGPGVIDLKIDKLIQTDAQKRELRALLEAVLQKASQYGEKIPADVLRKTVIVPGVIFNDCNVEWVNEAVKKLQTLIAEP